MPRVLYEGHVSAEQCVREISYCIGDVSEGVPWASSESPPTTKRLGIMLLVKLRRAAYLAIRDTGSVYMTNHDALYTSLLA